MYKIEILDKTLKYVLEIIVLEK